MQRASVWRTRMLGAASIFAATTGALWADTCPDPVNGAAITAAKSVVRQLYAQPDLVEVRNDISLQDINALAPSLSAGLLRDLAAYWEALALIRDTGDPDTKSDYADGPLFHSNYEGMTGFRLFSAAARADQTIHVTLKMDHLSPLGSTEWSDVAVLRCDAGTWALADVLFDPTQTAGPSLRDRIAVD